MSMKGLENYYSGDDSWQAMVNLAMASWTDSEPQRELVRLMNGDRDLAAVVYARMGEHSQTWITGKVPALGGKSPLSCLASPSFIRRLREMLMRMD